MVNLNSPNKHCLLGDWMSKNKLMAFVFVFNVLMALAFVYGNFSLWASVSTTYPTMTASQLSPFSIHVMYYHYTDGTISVVQGIFLYFNYPFWLFWVSMIGNLVLMVLILRRQPSQEK